ADLAPFVTRDGHDERGSAHPVLPERRLVDEASHQHVAMHPQEVLRGEPQRLVWRLGHLRGHVEPRRTVSRVYTRRGIEPCGDKGYPLGVGYGAGSLASGRGAR